MKWLIITSQGIIMGKYNIWKGHFKFTSQKLPLAYFVVPKEAAFEQSGRVFNLKENKRAFSLIPDKGKLGELDYDTD